MATPFKNPRDGILYVRREVPEKLRPASVGKREVKLSLGTRDPSEAKAPFARENAKFEECLADARRLLAEGKLVLTPGEVVRKWCKAPAVGNGLTGSQRIIMTIMELDTAVGMRTSASSGHVFPPAIFGLSPMTDWSAVLADKEQFERILIDAYSGELEKTGSNWIRARWHSAESNWLPHLAGPIRRIKTLDAATKPKCSPPTLKKRIGAIQALLTYALHQRWSANNVGTDILIVGYNRTRRARRCFEDHELATLFASPLFVDPLGWRTGYRISNTTIFWLFLLALTTGARLEEVGQAALADVKRDGKIVYQKVNRVIDRYVSVDRRLVFHSLRHAFKSKGNDAFCPTVLSIKSAAMRQSAQRVVMALSRDFGQSIVLCIRSTFYASIGV